MEQETKGNLTQFNVSSQFLLLTSSEDKIRQTLDTNLQSGLDLDMSDRVKIPTGGGLTWQIPSADGFETSENLDGCVAWVRLRRALWLGQYNGQNAQPDCHSPDAKQGVGDPGGNCSCCPMSRRGSGDGEYSQACRLITDVYLLQTDAILPIILSLPPGSYLPMQQYLTRLARVGLPYYSVITRFSLERATSSLGIQYSRVAPHRLHTFEGEDAKRMEAYAAMIEQFHNTERPDAEPESEGEI